MSSLVLHDDEYGKLEGQCSPRIVKFINGITSERFPNWASITYANGSAVRIDSSLRSFRDQVDQYKKGRSISWSMIPLQNKVVGYDSAFALDLSTTKLTG